MVDKVPVSEDDTNTGGIIMVVFEVSKDPSNPTDAPYGGYIVSARVPAAGNDSALLAVFDSKRAADGLAEVLNHAAKLAYRDQYKGYPG